MESADPPASRSNLQTLAGLLYSLMALALSFVHESENPFGNKREKTYLLSILAWY